MRHAYVYDLASSTRYVLVRGRVGDTLRAAGIPAQWAPLRRGWQVRKERAADVSAILEAAGMLVHHVGGDPR
ncbi:hypothetical protein EDC82_1881 [Dermacoccus sp. SAI-028]|uniref:hypothetical protein n=1 Tax=Dermacoccus sp. SAI-028 TaxID=2768432 RepID=UPI0010436C87|nr:hypothetical protein [Dermacoccus sp. SAI-028]TCJ92102.1 hypothetical protein EDC82_1881 [Dermacoccus sp. SAI-028]